MKKSISLMMAYYVVWFIVAEVCSVAFWSEMGGNLAQFTEESAIFALICGTIHALIYVYRES